MPEEPGFYPVLSPEAASGVLGWAAVNPNSEISVRLMTRYDTPITPELLLSRLENAIRFREKLNIDADSYRLVHGEADGLPGLIVDKYNDVLVMQNGVAATEPHIQELSEHLIERLKPNGILQRFDSRNRKLEGLETFVHTAYGDVPAHITAREKNVQYLVDPHNGQKTGAFLDQRENKIALNKYAHGQALDVFSYHGSFGLHLANTCEKVICIDSSAPALARAQENANLNKKTNMEFTESNAFDFLRNQKRGTTYQTISLDPPALAKARKDLDAAWRAYKELNLRAMRLLDTGGILGTASCSYHLSEQDFYDMLQQAAQDAGKNVRVLERRSQSSDHPEILNVPESRYLKYAILEII